MGNGERAFVQGYNCPAAVSSGTQVIVATNVSGTAGDAPHLNPMAKAVWENLRKNPKEVSADAGYWSEANKAGGGFRQFLLRGIEKVREEWNPVCLGHNLKKLHRHHLNGAAPA